MSFEIIQSTNQVSKYVTERIPQQFVHRCNTLIQGWPQYSIKIFPPYIPRRLSRAVRYQRSNTDLPRARRTSFVWQKGALLSLERPKFTPFSNGEKAELKTVSSHSIKNGTFEQIVIKCSERILICRWFPHQPTQSLPCTDHYLYSGSLKS